MPYDKTCFCFDASATPASSVKLAISDDKVYDSNKAYQNKHGSGGLKLDYVTSNYIVLQQVSDGIFCLKVSQYSLGLLSSGSGCSKLTTSLVNVSLNFQKLISQIMPIFFVEKCEKLLQ